MAIVYLDTGHKVHLSGPFYHATRDLVGVEREGLHIGSFFTQQHPNIKIIIVHDSILFESLQDYELFVREVLTS